MLAEYYSHATNQVGWDEVEFVALVGPQSYGKKSKLTEKYIFASRNNLSIFPNHKQIYDHFVS